MSDTTLGGISTGTEEELEAFRQRWRQEVSDRNLRTAEGPGPGADVQSRRSRFHERTAVSRSEIQQKTRTLIHDQPEEFEPKSYHDLPDKEEHLKLESQGQNHDRNVFNEPKSALEHYERAVEKESRGQLGDSLLHYRKAFKLDDSVDLAYKKKHFPMPLEKPKAADTRGVLQPPHQDERTLTSSTNELIAQFSDLRIEAPPPASDASPRQRSYLGEMPDEILTLIFMHLAMADVASFGRLSLVCKRLAWFVMTEESIWRSVMIDSKFGLTSMLYRYTCDMGGPPVEDPDPDFGGGDLSQDDIGEPTRVSSQEQLSQLLNNVYRGSWRQMFRSRPRIRFNGCYISTVNYTRTGGNVTNTLTWGVPVHSVTYYRYLRFFQDGTLISLLTTAEPIDVVHHLIKENLHNHHGNALPSSVMKDALRGRWRLSGPEIHDDEYETEQEGEVHIETEGVVPKYMYAMRLAFSHAGKGARNNKLAWRRFQSYNKLTDDWAEFNRKNDKAYYWSRVKSFNSN